jgi:aconitate hydratase
MVFARKPGDGSAREQAASCQKVLGGFANIAYEYATKRYRSNCINWGIVPFTLERSQEFTWQENDHVFVPGIRQAILDGNDDIPAQVLSTDEGGQARSQTIMLHLGQLTDTERRILVDGCLINYYREVNTGE